MYRWAFTVGDGSWFCQRVTSAARETPDPCGIVVVMRDDTFTVISVDDPGPCQLPDYSSIYDPWAPSSVTVPKCWHVVLLQLTLVWMEASWFEQCELLGDAV